MDVTVEKKLQDLWKLQQIDNKLDNLKAVLGELPMEVSDLEDDIAGFETRVNHIQEEITSLDTEVANKKLAIKDFQRLIDKYEDQLNNIKNSREFEAIDKEKEIAVIADGALKKIFAEVGEQSIIDSMELAIKEIKTSRNIQITIK